MQLLDERSSDRHSSCISESWRDAQISSTTSATRYFFRVYLIRLWVPSEGFIQLQVPGPCCLVSKSCPTLCNPMDYVASQALLSMGFSRQGYWNGLPCPPPGDLPNAGIEHASPTLADRFFTTEPPGKPGAPSKFGCTVLDSSLLRWIQPLTVPSRKEPGAGWELVRSSRASQRGVGRSRKKEEETGVRRGAITLSSHTEK